MQKRTPSVSVVVPLYNHAAYIADAISSILAQGPIVQEIIVIDDGSTDSSADIMSGLARGDSRIHFEAQQNQGAHATLNRAIDQASGEFIAILNSDDLYEKNRLATLVKALDASPEFAIAASALTFIDANAQPQQNPWYEAAAAEHRNGLNIALALLNGNFLMTTSNLVFRRGRWPALGRFADLRYAHDLDWLLRALANSHQILILNQPLLKYRMHGHNTINEDHAAVRIEWAMSAAAYLATLWDQPQIDWPHAAAAQTLLRRHELDRAVTLCVAYLHREHQTALDKSHMPQAQDFKAVLKTCT